MSRKYLTPIVLPADPAAAMEAATKQYVDGRTPPSGSSFVANPSYAGPWRKGGSTTDPIAASYSNMLIAGGKEGMLVDSAGFVRFFGRTGLTTGTNQFQWSELAADHVTETWIASLRKDWWQLGDLVTGQHPVHSLYATWVASDPNGGSYIWMRGADGTLFLNAPTNGISLRVNNATYLSVTNSRATFGTPTWAQFTPASNAWDTSSFLAVCPSGSQARLGINCGSWASQLRMVDANGPRVDCINGAGSAYEGMGAAAFNTVSTAAIKRKIRTLRPQRERIVVRQPWDADIVGVPDVMALRPVAFRPKVGAIHADGTPAEGIIGHEGTRERLGLIAEEVQHVVPSAVTHNADGGVLGIDYAQITVALLDHVQQLTKTIETLQYRITELEHQSPTNGRTP